MKKLFINLNEIQIEKLPLARRRFYILTGSYKLRLFLF